MSDMRLAVTDWESGSFAGFEVLLDRHRPKPGERDLRGWEWHHLESLRHVPVCTKEVVASLLVKEIAEREIEHR
jgi:hypothetical protein